MKNIRGNIAVIGVACLLMSMGASDVNAQGNRRAKADCPKGITLSDQQKEQVKATKIEFAKATKDLKNELNELRAHQQTLMSAEKPNVKGIYANIDKASDLKNQLMKERIAMKLDMQSFLSDEQKLMAANRPMHKQGMRSGRKGKMKNGQGRKKGVCVGNNDGFARGDGRGQGRQGMKEGRPNCNLGDFSDEQKEQMKELRLAHLKNTKELRDEAEELSLKQKHMMTSENPDKKMIMENLDRLSGIQNKLAKTRVDHQMEVRKILTEDQLSLFLSHSGMRKGFGNGNRHRSFNK